MQRRAHRGGIGLLPVDWSEVDTNFAIEGVVHHPSIVSKSRDIDGFASFWHGFPWPFDDQGLI